jgi:mannose-1-phosphate guanylyltransferase
MERLHRGPRRSCADGLWIIVLAGGEGTRLAPLTRALYGTEVPKQFAVLTGERSLLQHTVARATRMVPAERILVVVAEQQRAVASAQLAGWPGVELVTQPRSLGTGPGILLPLARIRARAPRARVAVFPADHHFADDRPLLATLRAVRRGPARHLLTLLGVVPDSADADYGWIVRGLRLAGPGADAFAVRRFQEKPGELIAGMLRARGALWNTFISTGPVAEYWRLARTHLPVHARLFEKRSSVDDIYARMEPADFSRDLLGRASSLAVAPLAGSGWSDWGSPRRVFQSLAGTPDHAALLARISGGGAGSSRYSSSMSSR